jgi:hypothetical protein
MEKENEIRRLHSVCRAKDQLIVLLIEDLEYIINEVTAGRCYTPPDGYIEQVRRKLEEAKASLG